MSHFFNIFIRRSFMKIVVTATGGSMSARVDERFGRCSYFVIVDSDTMRFTAFSNPASDFSGGSGPAAAGQIAKHDAEVLLTGNVGGKAQKALEAAGIKVVTGVAGTVSSAVEDHLKAPV
jgi:predicted Fe-Mo cluster-binding NifX family protein